MEAQILTCTHSVVCSISLSYSHSFPLSHLTLPRILTPTHSVHFQWLTLTSLFLTHSCTLCPLLLSLSLSLTHALLSIILTFTHSANSHCLSHTSLLSLSLTHTLGSKTYLSLLRSYSNHLSHTTVNPDI